MIDKQSSAWRTVEEWATGRLEKHRRKVETDGKSEADYAALRAKIKTLTALLSLTKPTQEQDSE